MTAQPSWSAKHAPANGPGAGDPGLFVLRRRRGWRVFARHDVE
jgi:hypothetical protein